MVEFPIYRSAEHRERAPHGQCSCVGCALSAGFTKFQNWSSYCKVRGTVRPDEARFADRFALSGLYLTRDSSPVSSRECDALANAMKISEETAMEILEAAKAAASKGVQVHEGHRDLMRRLGQRYCQALLSEARKPLSFQCIPIPKKPAVDPALCIDTWDDWFPAAGIAAAVVVDNEVIARWAEPVPIDEMQAYCASRANLRGPVLRTWTLHHSTAMISMMPHPGSISVCYAMTRPMVLLSQDFDCPTAYFAAEAEA